jgi:hypothetical protein
MQLTCPSSISNDGQPNNEWSLVSKEGFDSFQGTFYTTKCLPHESPLLHTKTPICITSQGNVEDHHSIRNNNHTQFIHVQYM